MRRERRGRGEKERGRRTETERKSKREGGKPFRAALASWAYTQGSHEALPQKGSPLCSVFCCQPLGFLDNFLTRTPTFSFCTGCYSLCSWSCLRERFVEGFLCERNVISFQRFLEIYTSFNYFGVGGQYPSVDPLIPKSRLGWVSRWFSFVQTP